MNAIGLLQSDIKQFEKAVSKQGNTCSGTVALIAITAVDTLTHRTDSRLLLVKRELLKVHSLQLQEYVSMITEYVDRLEEKHAFLM